MTKRDKQMREYASEELRDGAFATRETVRLTDDEREAIGNMIHLIECQHEDYGKEAHALRNLLERTK